MDFEQILMVFFWEEGGVERRYPETHIDPIRTSTMELSMMFDWVLNTSLVFYLQSFILE